MDYVTFLFLVMISLGTRNLDTWSSCFRIRLLGCRLRTSKDGKIQRYPYHHSIVRVVFERSLCDSRLVRYPLSVEDLVLPALPADESRSTHKAPSYHKLQPTVGLATWSSSNTGEHSGK